MNLVNQVIGMVFLLLLVLSSSCAVLDEDTATAYITKVPRPTRSTPLTFYVRTDGGTAAQCTGLVDAPYTEGQGTECAWAHPFIALPPDSEPRLYAGDTLIIGAGSYMMGYGAPSSDQCDADYPWDCHMTSVPGGLDAQHPTRILGAGWDSGCESPPELWGTERSHSVLNLDGSRYVEIACLDITDHAGCAEDHTGGLACKKGSYPYGAWAYDGIQAADAANIILRDLTIHGLASAGIRAGRISDWLVERVRITANGWVGWEGDIDGEDANTGTLTFRHWTVDWNGCVETYPGKQIDGCWAQTAGGYGDGVGTGATGGTWLIEDAYFLYNTSDGLDLLYAREDPSEIVLRRVIAMGNAGNQIKTNGPTHIENAVIVSNCDFFEGKPFTHHVDTCRAMGNALSLYLQKGNLVTLVNNTIASAGDCLVIAECDSEHSHCDGTERVELRNNIFYGYPDINDPTEFTCLVYAENFGHNPFDIDYSLIYHTKSTPPCPGAHDVCEIDPGLVNVQDIDAFDGRLIDTSMAINRADPESAPVNDFSGRLRDSMPDIGAYEWVPGDVRALFPLVIQQRP